jgi:hypothetical protein
LAFVNFSLTAMERMEGTVMVEVVEDAAKVLIVELEKMLSMDGGGIWL